MADYPIIPTLLSTNSSIIPLVANGVFTGTATDVLMYSTISINVFSNVASAIDGLQIQQSSDAVNWRITDFYTVPANTGKTFSAPRTARYCRIVYTNGGTLQTTFELQTILSIEAPNPSSVRPQDSRTNDNDMLEVVAFPMVYDPITNTWSRNREGKTRNRVGQYALSSFRTLGTAATPQNIFTIENPTGSGKSLAIKKIEILMDTTALLATVAPSIKLSRPTALPTGGTILTANKWKTADVATIAICRGGTASDGGAATAITATAGATITTQLVDRLHTAAGWVSHREYTLLFELAKDDPFILAPGEALLVQGVLANAATTHFVVNCLWEDFT